MLIIFCRWGVNSQKFVILLCQHQEIFQVFSLLPDQLGDCAVQLFQRAFVLLVLFMPGQKFGTTKLNNVISGPAGRSIFSLIFIG